MLRAAAVFLALLAGTAAAQPASGVSGIVAARQAAEHAHLWRVGAWGAANAAAGTLLLATAGDADGRRAFGIQSAAWGAVNIAIAGVGLATASPDTLLSAADAIRAEAHLANILWLNLGLDAGYAAVGATLWIVAARGVSNPAAWRGHGRALVVQGVGLFVLDAVVLAGSSGRLGALADLAQHAVLVPTGTGLALVIGL